MPRKLRLEFPGAMYHLMSRGDQREDIFLCDVDRYDFLKTLAEACRKTDWQVHAFCLMRNHYHLVVETPHPNLVAGMAWLQSTYTIRLNNRHNLTGHVPDPSFLSLGNSRTPFADDWPYMGTVVAAKRPVGLSVSVTYPT